MTNAFRQSCHHQALGTTLRTTPRTGAPLALGPDVLLTAPCLCVQRRWNLTCPVNTMKGCVRWGTTPSLPFESCHRNPSDEGVSCAATGTFTLVSYQTRKPKMWPRGLALRVAASSGKHYRCSPICAQKSSACPSGRILPSSGALDFPAQMGSLKSIYC